jgi:hypothetical protein
MIKFQFHNTGKLNKLRQKKLILYQELNMMLMIIMCMENKDLYPLTLNSNNMIRHYNQLILITS